MRTSILLLLSLCPTSAAAEIARYGGSPDPLPHDAYVHVVSEADSPVIPTWIKAKDGVYIAAAIRKPGGTGPFPAIILFHGAPGGRGMDQLVGWSRGDHGGPVWERFLQQGFVVVVADYRGGPWNSVNAPSADGTVTAIDDGVSVIEHVRSLPYVDADRVSLYGVSLGGNLVMFLASAVPDVHAVVAGAPAPIWFLGERVPTDGTRPDFSAMRPDPATAAAWITPIEAPVLILVGTVDELLPLSQILHDELERHGKRVRMEIYDHGYHDFVLGPQGQPRADLPGREILLEGALEALEHTVAFVESPRGAHH